GPVVHVLPGQHVALARQFLEDRGPEPVDAAELVLDRPPGDPGPFRDEVGARLAAALAVGEDGDRGPDHPGARLQAPPVEPGAPRVERAAGDAAALRLLRRGALDGRGLGHAEDCRPGGAAATECRPMWS